MKNSLTLHAAIVVGSASALLFAPLAVRAQTSPSAAALIGTVYIDTTNARITDAEIVFPKLNLAARTDTAGNFQITGIPVGPQEFIVRRVGYKPYGATITFRLSQKVEADFMLEPIVTKLSRVNVRANADPRYAIRLADFEDRRRIGTGRFLTADVFEHAVGQNMSQVLVSLIPGVRTAGKGTKQVLVGRDKCAVQVIVNGMTWFNGSQDNVDINSFYTAEVIGLEYYTVANTPSQFNATAARGPMGLPSLEKFIPGGSVCGTVVIWTK